MSLKQRCPYCRVSFKRGSTVSASYICSFFFSQPNPVASANAKLALLFDWLCYKPESDSIMNIGEGGLVPG